MSSYTSNSNNHRSYVLGLLAIVLIPVSALLSLGVYLQPLYGDLTRIGSFEEVNFGWNMPQLTFSHTGLKFPSSMKGPGSNSSVSCKLLSERKVKQVLLGSSISGP